MIINFVCDMTLKKIVDDVDEPTDEVVTQESISTLLKEQKENLGLNFDAFLNNFNLKV